jgi:SAM-dependent methyltransferase
VKVISRKEYNRLLAAINWPEYLVMRDPAWLPGTSHIDITRERYFRIMCDICRIISPGSDHKPVIVDFGCFPGDLGLIMRKYFGDAIKLIGIGLALRADFRQAMSDNKVYDSLLEVDIDPENPLFATNDFPADILLPEKSVDLIIAAEIFEHLYSPINFITQAARVLSTGGTLLITTPNVSYFGNICRLACGRSIFPSLPESHIYQKSEWRAHMRVYDASEIKNLMSDGGLEEVKHYMIDSKDDARRVQTFSARLKMFFIRLSYIIPYFRNQYIGLFKKT